MKRFKAQKSYFTLIMLILGVLLIAGCDGSDEAALLLAQHEDVLPGACTAAGPKVDTFLTSPPNNLEDVAISTVITAHFDEAMDPATLVVTNPGDPEMLTFTLRDNNDIANTEGTVAMSVGDTIATFTPSANLHGDSWYTVTITTYAKDTDGNPLGCSYKWEFKTVAP